jgi:hypothetical protein
MAHFYYTPLVTFYDDDMPTFRVIIYFLSYSVELSIFYVLIRYTAIIGVLATGEWAGPDLMSFVVTADGARGAGILSAFPVFPPREPALRISGTLEPACQLEPGRNLRGRILVVNTMQPKCRILLQREGFFRWVQRYISKDDI